MELKDSNVFEVMGGFQLMIRCYEKKKANKKFVPRGESRTSIQAVKALN
jgi:hypothetical protein